MKTFCIFLFAMAGNIVLATARPSAESTPPTAEPGTAAVVAKVAVPARVKKGGQPLSIIRVNSTVQPYDFVRPWTKKAPTPRRGIGAIVESGKVLVTAGMVANASYLELEAEENGERWPATVIAVDYEADLALLAPVDAKALQGRPALQIRDAVVSQQVEIAQLEPTGAQVSTDALITTAAISPYPLTELPLLSYRLAVSLQYREGSYTLPILRKGQLVGMLLRYDSRSQTAEAISAPVIRHFLQASAKRGGGGGFSTAGLEFAPLRDAQLRRFAQAEQETGGVYITQVAKHGAADEGGIKSGDVLLAVAGQAVDADGNYQDRIYGKIAVPHVISTLHDEGETIPFEILREGKRLTVPVKLTHRPLDDYVIPPSSEGRAPKYYVLGGLVLVELSRGYLREWGSDWQKKAPERFVYLDRFQDELYPEGGQKIVILSQVLPTPLTIGDEQLGGLVITKVNDQPLKSLADLPGLLEKPVNGFQKLEFNESPRVLYLDAAQAAAIAPQVQQRYGLPTMQRLR